MAAADDVLAVRVYRITSGNARIVGIEGKDYGTLYDAKFWSNNESTYKLFIVPTGNAGSVVTLQVGAPIALLSRVTQGERTI